MTSRCSYSRCSTNKNDQAANNTANLLGCSRCKSARYCSTACQKKDWVFHKFKCVSPEVTRHEVQGGFSIDAIQSAINAASPGDIVVIKEGSYGEDGESTLFVNKPIHLWGGEENRDNVVLNCNLVIDESDGDHDGSKAVVVAGLFLNGTVTISDNSYKSVTLCNIELKCPNNSPRDALKISGCKGKCLILGCDIYGGSDGVHIASEGVHLKRTCIQYAQHRGIFSRRIFTVEDCEVSGCGGYGIKGSAGWTEKGRHNDIQPGPWSSDGPWSSGW